jgi:hypothetical protein
MALRLVASQVVLSSREFVSYGSIKMVFGLLFSHTVMLCFHDCLAIFVVEAHLLLYNELLEVVQQVDSEHKGTVLYTVFFIFKSSDIQCLAVLSDLSNCTCVTVMDVTHIIIIGECGSTAG